LYKILYKELVLYDYKHSISNRVRVLFSLLLFPDRPWGPIRFLFSEYRGLFPWWWWWGGGSGEKVGL